MSLFNKFRKDKGQPEGDSGVIAVPCPYCGEKFGLPAHLKDTGEVSCPYCQEVGQRMPCSHCGKIFVFRFSGGMYTSAECPHCHEKNMVFGSR
jgi:DNA-directed RNA polymerase subunit RPC12/RpoP